MSEQMDRIEALLERIANAVAPTPEQTWEQYEAEAFERSYENALSIERMRRQIATPHKPLMTNAIGGQQTGRGVR